MKGTYYKCDRCDKELKDDQMKAAGDFFNVEVKDVKGEVGMFRSFKMLCAECEDKHTVFMHGRELAPEK